MKRFVKKAKRRIRRLNINPKVIGVLSVFVIALGVFTISSVFAEDVQFSMTPDKNTPYQRSAPGSSKYATVAVKVDCADNLAWDNISINIDYDSDVFTFNRSTLKKTRFDEEDIIGLENPGALNVQEVGDTPGRYSFLITNMDETQELKGQIYVADLRFKIKETAPGGETTISFRVTTDTDTTAASNGDETYTANYTDAQLVISVPVDTDSIAISPDSLELDINTNQEATLTPQYEPEGANEPPMSLSFVSLNENYATVDQNGVVRAVAPGDTTIRVSLFGETIDVPVAVKAGLISIALDQESVELNKGGEKTYTVTNNPTNTTDTVTYNWTSSNTSAATVDSNGKVTAVGGGQTTITATAVVNGIATNKTATSLVTVNVPLDSISGSPSQINLQRGIDGHNDATITVSYVPTDTTVDRTVHYTINPSSGVATVSDTGVVTAVGAGDAVVTGRVGAKTFQVNVHVDVPIKTFTISPSSADLYVGQGRQLTADFTPTKSEINENTNIRWTTSNANVATVDEDGYVTAVGSGTATITGYTGSGEVGSERLHSSTAINVYEEIEGAVMSESAFTLYTNDNSQKTKTLTVTINPTGSGIPSDRNITWNSSNQSAATVNNGVVTAVGNGTTTITATVGNGLATATATVTVETKVESFTVTNSKNITLEMGDTHQIEYTVLPTNASHPTVTWTSGNEEKATVSPSGIITPQDNGDVTITGQVEGKSQTIIVHIITPATSVTIDQGEAINLEKNTFTTLNATVEPSTTTDTVSWSTSDPETVSVDSTGKITALKKGSATITATAGAKTDTITVNVVVPATGFEITDSDFILNQGNYKTISRSVTPTDTTDVIAWSSSANGIAEVDQNGKVTAKSTGNATITGTINGHSDTVNVTVVLPAESIEITGANPLVIQKGETPTLNATITPAGATGTINWESSNTNVATIDSDGKITTVGTGVTTITATVGDVTDSITLNVIKSATGIEITEGTSTTVNKNDTKTLHATLTPGDSTDNIVWSTSDSSTVSISSNGVITGKKAGSATITATVSPVTSLQASTQGANGKEANLSQAGEITDTITVNVLVPTTSISLTDGDSISMIKGQERTLGKNIQPSDSTDTITWETSNPNIATVDQNGKVNTVGTGNVTITVRAGSKSDTITIGVSLPADSVTINGTKPRTVHRGGNTTLTATVTPSGSTDGLTWVSSNPSVATVDSSTGEVNALAIGSTVITARAGGKTDTITINVDAPITNFDSDEKNISIVKGQTKNLTYTITPTDTTDDRTVTWNSNDTTKVTVDSNGKITAKAAGSTTVVATLGTRTITYNITVTIIPVNGITLNKDTLSVRKGETDSSLTYTITPANTTEDKTVTWESDDNTVATVDSNGKVTGKKAGTAHITVRCGTYNDSVTVTVVEVPATGIDITNSDDTIEIGDTYRINVVAEPRDTTDKLTFRFTSSDESIATVDENGVVHAKKSGTVTITVQSEDGSFTDTMELNVVVPSVAPNPNTGVESVYVYLLSAIISLFGTIIIAKKRFN